MAKSYFFSFTSRRIASSSIQLPWIFFDKVIALFNGKEKAKNALTYTRTSLPRTSVDIALH